MSESVKVFRLVAGVDESGEREVFSWDLIPLVPAQDTLHLDTNGLPKVGTCVSPGMILIGKIGRSSKYEMSRKPTALEVHELSFRKLKMQFGKLWIDGSLRVPADCYGEVIESRLDMTAEGEPVAFVRVQCRN